MKYLSNEDDEFSHAFKYCVYEVDELGYPIKERGGRAYMTAKEAHLLANELTKQNIRTRVFEEVGYSAGWGE